MTYEFDIKTCTEVFYSLAFLEKKNTKYKFYIHEFDTVYE